MAIGFNNDVNNLGILNGTIGTDYRNIIQIVQGQADMSYSTSWSGGANNNYYLIHQGTIIPKNSSSKIIIQGHCSVYNPNYSIANSYFRTYYSMSSFGTVRVTNSSSAPSGTLLDIFFGAASDSGLRGWSQTPILSVISGLTVGTTYYLALFSVQAGQAHNYNASNSKSEIIFMEII